MLVSLAAVCFLGAPAISQEKAEQPASLRIAVINLQKINAEGVVFKNIRKQLEEYRSSLQGLIQAEEDELRKADRELARKRAIVSPEAYAQERRKFEKRVVDFQRQVQKRKQSMNEVRSKAVVEANKAVGGVVASFAAQNNISIILRTDTVAFFSKKMDITDVIIAGLNESVTTVKVPEPKE
ncbi:MAG: OmpH family outer membrane protein [Rhodospirillales bacterium]|jgi:outer membrane protein|nr:OmpH family outer membrane protein [Rhodospirillales bacterium]